MAQASDLTSPILQHDWAQLSEISAAVRRSLDDAPADLAHAAIEDPTEACVASRVCIDRVPKDRMVPYWNLDWAVDRVAALQHALEEGLRQEPYRSDEGGDKVSGS